ncbi:CE112 protein, partial [Serilophus lunatus]|nr:CE112 protein [Serilophus lunatus]
FKMSSEEEICDKLDVELDHYIMAMKPYVLSLQDDSERHVCALWIKKLCRPSGAGIGTEGRQNRNLYAKLLLHMLKRGVLDSPFAQKPEEGLLKTLPSYMLIYLDELNSPTIPRNKSGWALGEQENSEGAEESPSSKALTQGNEKPSVIPHSLGCPHQAEEDEGTSQSDDQHKTPVSLDDSDLEARLSSWNLGLENPRYLREKPVPMSLMTPKISPSKGSPSRDQQAQFRTHEKQLELQMTIAEGKFHEEKLKLQQKHVDDIQKILSRKNNEIEALKSTYTKKEKESEEMIRKLEKKVQTLIREAQVVREAKEQQIMELKKMCEKTSVTLNNEWDKRV